MAFSAQFSRFTGYVMLSTKGHMTEEQTVEKSEKNNSEGKEQEEFPVRWGRVLSFLFGGVFLIILSLLSSHIVRKDADEEWQKGLKFEQAGKVNEAVEIYQKILTKDPQNIKVNLKLGEILFSQKQYKKARSHYKEVLASEPENIDALAAMGDIQRLQKKPDTQEAEDYYKKALAINAKMVRANRGLGIICIQQKRYDQALQGLHRALETDPENAECYYLIGISDLQQKNYDSAVLYFQRALSCKPDFESAKRRIQQALALQGTEKGGAIEQYQKLLKTNPDNALAHNNLGLLLLKKGRLEEAIAHYEAALKVAPLMPDALKNMANAMVIKKDYPKAEEYYEKAIKLTPQDPTLYNNLGSLYAYQQQIAKAVTYYKKALELKPDYYEAEKNLTKAQRDLQQVEKAK